MIPKAVAEVHQEFDQMCYKNKEPHPLLDVAFTACFHEL